MMRRVALAAVVLMAACVDGSNPVGPETVSTVQLAVSPSFALAPSAVEAAALTRARVTALDASTGEALAVVQEDVDPSAREWRLQLSLDVPGGNPLSVVLQTELASVTGGAESVEWSGRTSSFKVQAGGVPLEVKDVTLYRGPLANLAVTALSVENAPTSVLEGESVQLQVGVLGGSGGARVYFHSDDPSVATVDATGMVRTLAPGTARITAEAGPASTSVSFTVDSVQIDNPIELSGSVSEQVDYASSTAGTMGDPAGAAAITSALSDLTSAVSGGDGAGAVRAFEAAVTAWQDYGAGSSIRALDAPQLGVIELMLIVVSDALGIEFG